MNKRVGAFTGKFYPPHIGHLSVIDNALKNLDEVYVVISKNDLRNESIKNQFGFEVLSAEKIKHWFELHYKSESRVKVAIFDESGLRPYPEDRDVWANKFKKEFSEVNVKIADEGYREYNEKYFPEYEFYPIDREIMPIHSTMLRSDMKNYLDYLIPEAREYFEKKLKEK